jgi:mono/diheme cytochrome c family protein
VPICAGDILKMGAATVAIVLCASASSLAQESRIGNLRGQAKRGEALYGRYCIGCHGERGDGEGENAPYVRPEYPKPRDFTAGLFKCRSTPSGSIPLDSDLFETVARGIDTTAMPQWFPLTHQERADLVAYVKGFSSRFKEEHPDPPVVIPPETTSTPESVAKGKELYQKVLMCGECHGPEGRGDGPSASTLRDNRGDPIRPYDFTTGARFKCGQTDHDLARIFLTGLDGTPMPTFADYLRGDEIWDLVHYLRSLQSSATRKKG